MRVHRMEKGIPGYTIRTGGHAVNDQTRETGSVVGPTVAADFVTARVAQVRIIDSELGVIEDVECFRAKFNNASFPDDEVLQNTQVKVGAVGISQEVTSRISERQPARSDELIGISQQRSKAFGVVSLIRRQSWRGFTSG